MADEVLKRDANRITVVAGVTDDASQEIKMLRVDPSTGRLKATATVTGSFAPSDATYVTLSTNATLTNERVLTGTASQITVTDNGAGSTVVLSTPQNIATTSTPTFASETLTGASSLTLGTASTNTGAIIFKNSTNANNLTIQAGATSGATTLTLPVDDGTAGQFLKTDGAGVLSWDAAGAGNVTGPGSSTDNAVARFDGVGGTTLQNSVVTVGDTGIMAGASIDFGANTITATSLQVKTAVSDETGSGALVFAETPTLVTPVLGAATATSINGLTITSSTGTLTITNGKTLSVSNTLTFAGTDGNTLTFPSGNDTVVTLTATQTLSGKTLTAPKFADGGFIADANGNEILVLDTVATAVNEITLANAATAGNPALTASGDDANVGIDVNLKGTGSFNIKGNATQAAELRLYEDTDAGTNYSAFKVGTQAGDITYTLPTDDGDAGQVLSTNGSGVLDWVTPSSGSTFTALPFVTDFSAATRAVTNTGAGSYFNTFATNGLAQGTGATGGSFGSVNYSVGSGSTTTYLFNAGASFSCSLHIDTIGTTASAFYGIGAITVDGTGHTYTDSIVGFKVLIASSVVSLYGVTGSGAAGTATSALTTIAVNETVFLRVDIVSTSSVKFYYRKTNGAWSSATEITTNIPTSTTAFLHSSLSNDSTATASRIDVAYMAYQQ